MRFKSQIKPVFVHPVWGMKELVDDMELWFQFLNAVGRRGVI